MQFTYVSNYVNISVGEKSITTFSINEKLGGTNNGKLTQQPRFIRSKW